MVALGNEPPVYEPAKQIWARGGTPEKPFWVGIEDLMPGPRDLEREVGIFGPLMRLADKVDDANLDGGRWRVPVIRRWDRANMVHVPNLPKVISMQAGSAGGSW